MDIEVQLCIAKGSGDVHSVRVAQGATLQSVLRAAGSRVGSIDPEKFTFTCDGQKLSISSVVHAGDYIVASPAKAEGN
jgi:hypothetical protein